MSLNWAKPGRDYVPAYQASGWPFTKTITGLSTTPVCIKFPYVTRWFALSVHANAHRAVRIGFTENGVDDVEGDGCYFLIETDEKDAGGGGSNHSVKTIRFEIKCKELWVRTDTGNDTIVSVIAGYTNIALDQFPVLTGSAGWVGVG